MQSSDMNKEEYKDIVATHVSANSENKTCVRQWFWVLPSEVTATREDYVENKDMAEECAPVRFSMDVQKALKFL